MKTRASSKVLVVLISMMLISWVSISNFEPVFADSVTITTPVSGSSFVVGSPITFIGNADDADSLEWRSDIDGIIGIGSSISFDLLSLGTHLITLTDTDEGTSDSITITINPADYPTISISSPEHNAIFRAGDKIPFTATATDIIDGDLTSSIVWSFNTVGKTGTGGSYLAPLPVKTTVVTASVTDSDGNTSSMSIVITVNPASVSKDDPVVEKLKQKEREKNTKKYELKAKQKQLKEEIKTIKDLKKDLKFDANSKKELKSLKLEIKELLQDLRENYDYEQELFKEIKDEIETTELKEDRSLNKHIKTFNDKMDSKLSSFSKSSEPQTDSKKLGFDFKSGKTKVVLKVSDLQQKTLDKIEAIGKVDAKNNNQIQVTVDLADISKLSSLSNVEKVRPPFSAIQYEQPMLSEGVYFIDADIVQYAGITGKGVKVAVLDIAFDPTNSKISDNVVAVKSFRNGYQYSVAVEGTWYEHEHGTAVAEIITDVAPNVQLYLYTMQTDIEFSDAIDEAISQDVDIIVMAAGWPNLPTDGTSHITKKVEEAISHGIAFVVPSGNFANKHWEGLYSDSNLNGWHEFSSIDEGLSINVTESRIESQEPIITYLMWDEGLGDVSDFQLVLVDPLGQIVDYSANDQITKEDTSFEYIHHAPETEGLYALGIVLAGETKSPDDIPNVTLELFSPSDELEYPVPRSSVAVPSDADGAIVVGAVNHMNGQLEPFSSQGPTNDGKLAPHVVGPDGVTTIAFDGSPFFGTSATAPYIAGLAALLFELHPDMSTDQIISEIQQNTKSTLFSIGNEYDNQVGYGAANAVFMLQEKEVQTQQ